MRQILTNNTIGFEYGYKLNIINTKREVGLRNNNYVNQLPFFLSFYLYMSYTGKHIKASVSLYSFIPNSCFSMPDLSPREDVPPWPPDAVWHHTEPHNAS